MRKVLVVASKELKTFFQTPIGYVILFVFTALAAFLFFQYQRFFVVKEASMRGLFGLLPILFMVFAPAVTMRLWAEEKKSGTVETLLTMPVRDADLVLGKFLAAVVLVGLFLILTLPILWVVTFLGNPDPGPIIGGYFGALLLGAAYVSVGLAISALTENQIIALVLGVFVAFVFFLVGQQEFVDLLPAVLASALFNLSLASHFQSILRGVIDSRDVVYYVSFIGFFLYLNWWAVRRPRGKGVSVVLLAAILLVGNGLYLNSSFFKRLDLTEDRRYTLSDATKEILHGIEDDLILTAYLSSDLPAAMSNHRRDIEDLMREFESNSRGHLRVEIVNPEKNSESEKAAEEAGVPKVPLGSKDVDKLELQQAYLGLVIEFRDKRESIPFIPRVDTLEYETVLRIDKVTRTKEAKVAFQVNDPFAGMNIPGMQRPPQSQDAHSPSTDMGVIKQFLDSQFETETTDLKSEVDKSVRTIILANSAKLDESQQYWLDQFLMRGGNLVVLAEGTEPSSFGREMNQGGGDLFLRAPLETKTDALFSNYGFQINKDVVLDANGAAIGIPRQVGPFVIDEPVSVQALPIAFESTINQDHPLTKGLKQMIFVTPSSIELSPKPGVNATVLVRSSPKSSTKSGPFISLDPRNQEDPETFSSQYVLAALLEGEFHSYFTAREIPKDVLDALQKQNGEKDASGSSELKLSDPVPAKTSDSGDRPAQDPGTVRALESSESIPTPASEPLREAAPPPDEEPKESQGSTKDDGSSDGASEQDIPGGGVRFGQDLGASSSQDEGKPPQEDTTIEESKPESSSAAPESPTPAASAPSARVEPEGFLRSSPPGTKILVTGSSEFVTDRIAKSGTDNVYLLANAVDVMSSEHDLTSVRSKRAEDRSFETPSDAMRVIGKLVGLALAPVLILIAGIFYVFWRKVLRPAAHRRATATPTK